MISSGLASGEETIFDLDFHAVMHWGADPVLEKHYVPTRSQRAHSVLTFFASMPWSSRPVGFARFFAALALGLVACSGCAAPPGAAPSGGVA